MTTILSFLLAFGAWACFTVAVMNILTGTFFYLTHQETVQTRWIRFFITALCWTVWWVIIK